MFAYAVRRLLAGVLVLVAASLMVYFLIAVSGNPLEPLLLPPLLNLLAERAPGITLEGVLPRPEFAQDILSGTVDLVGFAYPITSPEISIVPICPVELVLVARRNHPRIGKVLDIEKTALRARFKEFYGVEEAELDALVAAGTDAESEAIDFFRFTSELKRQLSEEQRVGLIGLLWEIVYADGERSEMEDHAIWRIADLLGVSGRERIMKRQEVAGRVGAATGQEETDEG